MTTPKTKTNSKKKNKKPASAGKVRLVARRGGALVDKDMIASCMVYAVHDMLDGLSQGVPFDMEGMETHFLQLMNGLK
jgi:hypothetical protein